MSEVVVQGCSHPTTIGAGFDALEVAAVAARLSVQTMQPDGGYPDSPWDHAALSFRQSTNDPERARFMTERLEPISDCPTLSDACWCDRRAVDDLLAEARRWPLRETGGALLGWRGDSGPVVAQILGPGPDARHGLRSFEPDGEWQVEEGRRIYRQSRRLVAYLGDWHTHPGGSAKPSGQARRTAAMIASDLGFRAPRPVYAIAHRGWLRARRWGLTIYELRAGEFIELEIHSIDAGALLPVETPLK